MYIYISKNIHSIIVMQHLWPHFPRLLNLQYRITINIDNGKHTKINTYIRM